MRALVTRRLLTSAQKATQAKQNYEVDPRTSPASFTATSARTGPSSEAALDIASEPDEAALPVTDDAAADSVAAAPAAVDFVVVADDGDANTAAAADPAATDATG